MAWWLLLIFLTVAWLLILIAAAAEVGVRNAWEELPPEKRHGISAFFYVPQMPLVMLGMAKLLDWAVAPWGTYGVLALHGAVATWAVISTVRSVRRMREIESRR